MRLYNCTVINFHEIDIGIFFVRRNRKNINIGNRRRNNCRTRLIILQRFNFFFNHLRFFKLQIRCIFCHLIDQILFCFIKFSFDNITNCRNLLVVFFFGLISFTRSKTITNMIFQTNFKFVIFNIFLAQIIRTCS